MHMLLLLLLPTCAIAQAASTEFSVFLAANCTAAEKFAASELSGLLSNATRTPVKITPTPIPGFAGLTLAVGHAAATACGLSAADLLDLGNESFVVTSNRTGVKRGCVAMSGGVASQRGTIYAVYHWLRAIGVRFFAPDLTQLPDRQSAVAAAALPLDVTFRPTMEFRSMESFETNGGPRAINAVWEVRSHNNACGAAAGGCVVYATPPGSVHTSYNLLSDAAGQGARSPPADLYQTQREWFWPRDDGSAYGQLCWSNASLVSFLVGKVKGYLRQQPNANIISVSQNDNHNYCNDSAEAAIISQEGSPMGPLLRAVNQIADAIADEFPHVAVDTLAYQYTRPAPRITQPRPNVIIRLCNIECNFAAPLTDPSNAPFQKDMTDWGRISRRTWIWNYVTNFGAYVKPFPNYYVLSANIRYLVSHGVVGLYEEGNGHGPGGDLDAFKAYVAESVMWEPARTDDESLMTEFLDAYYGPGAPFVRQYMDLMHGTVADSSYYMGEHWEGVGFLTPISLLSAAEAFNRAAALTTGVQAQRVETAKLAVHYTMLLCWDPLRSYAARLAFPWPLAPSKEKALGSFVSTGRAIGLTHLNERGDHDLDWFSACVRNSSACGDPIYTKCWGSA